MTCDSCGKELSIGEWPWCPHGHGAALTEKSFPYTTTHLNGKPITVTDRAHESRLMKEFGVTKRDDAAWVEKRIVGTDRRTGAPIYKEGNGVGLPGCWV
jgi:hypothetical protein